MSDKVAVVTGASSGIGQASAKIFAENGYAVVAVGRNEKELASIARSHKSATVKIQLADVTELSQLDRVVNETVDHLGRIDVLVNSAGIIGNNDRNDKTRRLGQDDVR